MPHQCVKCSTIYKDGSNELLKGCPCGGRFFFFLKDTDIEEAKKITTTLTSTEKEQIENDVYDLIGVEDRDKPVILDFESIKILKPGKYELDLIDIFKKKPLIYKVADGKYVIDIVSTFEAKDFSAK